MQIWHRDNFFISTEKEKLDLEVIYQFLSNSYWGQGRSFEQIKQAIENSICFGVYQNNAQIGFGRVITDYSLFAYLGDVFILPEYQGNGLGKWLVETILNEPTLVNIKSWLLGTKDAHGLYEKFGFKPSPNPEKYMVKKS